MSYTEVKTRPWLAGDAQEYLRVLNCAALSSVVGEEDPHTSLDQLGGHLITSLTVSQHARQQYCIGFDAENASQSAYVCFNSFENTKDMVKDMCTLPSSDSDLVGHVHAGYSRRAAFVPHVVILDLFAKVKTLYFCGHGLGADVATLMALHCLSSPYFADHRSKIRVVGFGATLFGDRLLSRMLSQNDCHKHFHFYTFSGDIIPHLFWLCNELTAFMGSEGTSLPKELAARIMAFIGEKETTNGPKHAHRLHQLLQQVPAELVQKWQAFDDLRYAPCGRYYKVSPARMQSTMGHTVDIRALVTEERLHLPPVHEDGLFFPVGFKHAGPEPVPPVEDILAGVQAHAMDHCFKTLKEAIGNVFPKFRSQKASRVENPVVAWAPPENVLHAKGDAPANSKDLQYEVVGRKLETNMEKLHITLRGPFASLVRKACVSGTQVPVHFTSPMAREVAISCIAPYREEGVRVVLYTDFGESAEFLLDRARIDGVSNVPTGKMELLAISEPTKLLNHALAYSLYVGDRLIAMPLSAEDRERLEAPRRACFAQLDALCKDLGGEMKAMREDKKDMFRTKEFHQFKAAYLFEKTDAQVAEEREEEADTSGSEDEEDDMGNLDYCSDAEMDLDNSTRVEYLAFLLQDFQDDKAQSSIEVLRKFCPLSYLIHMVTLGTPVEVGNLSVAIGNLATMFGSWGAVREVQGRQRHLVTAGLAMCGAIFPIAVFTITWGAIVAVVGGITVSLTVCRILGSVYSERLDQMRRSMTADETPIFSEPYELERALWSRCEELGIIRAEDESRKSFELVIPVPDIIARYNEFFGHGVLWYARSSSRKVPVYTLIFALRMHALRNILAHDFSVGVVGTGNVGKSTLILEMYNFDTSPGYKIRTADIHPYYQVGQDRFHIVDFPHSNAAKKDLRAIFQSMSQFIDLAIVVVDCNHVDQDERWLIRWLTRCLKQRKVLDFIVCLNCADTLVPEHCVEARGGGGGGGGRRRRGEQRPADVMQLAPDAVEKLEQFRVQGAADLKTSQDRVILCAFDRSESNCTQEQAEQLGIKDANYVRDEWVNSMLIKHTRLSANEVKAIAEYDHGAEMDKVAERVGRQLKAAQELGHVKELALAVGAARRMSMSDDVIKGARGDLVARMRGKWDEVRRQQHFLEIRDLIALAERAGVDDEWLAPAKEELRSLSANSFQTRTMRSSNFLRLYHAESPTRRRLEVGEGPRDGDQLLESLRTFLKQRSDSAGKGWTDATIKAFVKDIKAAVKHYVEKIPRRLDELNTVQWAEAIWTLDRPQLDGHEICFIMNETLREDDQEGIEALMPFIFTLRARLVNRGNPLKHQAWPRHPLGKPDGAPVRRCHRGAGIPGERWCFFKPGRKFRVPFWFACSLEKDTAVNFAGRSSTREKVMFEICFPDSDEPCACLHVCLLTESVIPSEVEFLFVPYSMFEVLDVQTRTDIGALGSYLWVQVQAASDHKLDDEHSFGDEHLPLMQWG